MEVAQDMPTDPWTDLLDVPTAQSAAPPRRPRGAPTAPTPDPWTDLLDGQPSQPFAGPMTLQPDRGPDYAAGYQPEPAPQLREEYQDVPLGPEAQESLAQSQAAPAGALQRHAVGRILIETADALALAYRVPAQVVNALARASGLPEDSIIREATTLLATEARGAIPPPESNVEAVARGVGRVGGSVGSFAMPGGALGPMGRVGGALARKLALRLFPGLAAGKMGKAALGGASAVGGLSGITAGMTGAQMASEGELDPLQVAAEAAKSPVTFPVHGAQSAVRGVKEIAGAQTPPELMEGIQGLEPAAFLLGAAKGHVVKGKAGRRAERQPAFDRMQKSVEGRRAQDQWPLVQEAARRTMPPKMEPLEQETPDAQEVREALRPVQGRGAERSGGPAEGREDIRGPTETRPEAGPAKREAVQEEVGKQPPAPRPEDVEPPTPTGEPWRKTKAEYRAEVLDKSPLELVNMPEWLAAHKKGVEEALAAGKPVPLEVLKDYPGLKPPPVEQGAKGVEGGKPKRQARIGITQATRDVIEIARKHGESTEDVQDAARGLIQQAQGQPNAILDESFIQTDYSFADTKQGRMAARELKERLPKNLVRHVQIVPLSRHPNGSDVMAEIGTDKMADAIKFFADEGPSRVLNRMVGLLEMNPERFTPEEAYTIRRYAAIREAPELATTIAKLEKQEIGISELRAGDEFDILGSKHKVREVEGEDVTIVNDVNEVMPKYAAIIIDKGTLKRKGEDPTDLFGRRVFEPTTGGQKEMTFTRNVKGETVTETGVLTKEGKIKPDVNKAEEARLKKEIEEAGQKTIGEEEAEAAARKAKPPVPRETKPKQARGPAGAAGMPRKRPVARKIAGMPRKTEPAAETPRSTIEKKLAESRVRPEGKKIVRPRQIDRVLTKGLGVPIKARFASHRARNAVGLYFVKEGVIRNQEALDVVTTAHEAGHHLQHKVLGWRKGGGKDWPADVRKELLAAGKALYGDRKPPGGYASEGVAEYVRWRLMTDRATEMMPKTHAFISEKLEQHPRGGKVLAALATAGKLSKAYLAQGAEKRVEAKIVRGAPPRNEGRVLWVKLRTWLEDPIYPFKWINKKANLKLRPSQDTHQLGTMFQLKADAKAMGWISEGQVDVNGRVIGPPLVDVLAPVVRRGLYKEWDRYMKMRRVVQGGKQGKVMGFSRQDAQVIIDRWKNDPDFQRVTQDAHQFSENLLQYVIDSGGLSPGAATAMRKVWPIYTPFRRVFPEHQFGGGGKGKGYTRTGAAVKRFQEGGEEVYGFVEGITGNLTRAISIADRARVVRALRGTSDLPDMGWAIHEVTMPAERTKITVEQLRQKLEEAVPEFAERSKMGELPELDSVDQAALLTLFTPAKDYQGKENIVPIYDQTAGKMRFYEVHPELFRALNAMDSQNLPKMLTETIGRLTRLKRLGITGVEAGFSLTNAFKDGITHGAYSSGPMATAPLRLMRGYLDTIIGTEAARHFKRLGGGMSAFHGMDRKYMKGAVDYAMASTKARKALNIVKHPVELYREILSVPELAPRVAEFRYLLKKGRRTPGWTEADAVINAFNGAQEITVNFSKIGTAIRPVNQMFAYLSASIGGMRTFAGQARHHPARLLIRGLAGTSLGIGAYWWSVKDEEWWIKQPDWLKWGFWTVPINGELFRLPVPWELGHVFYSLPVAYVDALYRDDPESFKGAWQTALETDMPPGVPTGFSEQGILGALSDITGIGGLVETVANRKGFTGGKLVPRSQEKLIPEMQYRSYTTGAARWLGRKIADLRGDPAKGVSPTKLENLERSLTGGMFFDTVRAIEWYKRPSGTGEAADIPVVGRFFVRDSSHGSKVREEFYSTLHRLEQLEQSIKKRRPGDREMTMTDADRARLKVLRYIRAKRDGGSGQTVLNALHEIARATSDPKKRKEANKMIDSLMRLGLRKRKAG